MPRTFADAQHKVLAVKTGFHPRPFAKDERILRANRPLAAGEFDVALRIDRNDRIRAAVREQSGHSSSNVAPARTTSRVVVCAGLARRLTGFENETLRDTSANRTVKTSKGASGSGSGSRTCAVAEAEWQNPVEATGNPSRSNSSSPAFSHPGTVTRAMPSDTARPTLSLSNILLRQSL